MEVHVHGIEKRLLPVARRDREDDLEAPSVLTKGKKETRSEDWEEKGLHGQYLRQTKEVRSEENQRLTKTRKTRYAGCVRKLIMLSVAVSNVHRKSIKEANNNFGKKVHWKLAQNCNFNAGDNWYEHEPESVSENEDYKILWDFIIQTDHVIEALRCYTEKVR